MGHWLLILIPHSLTPSLPHPPHLPTIKRAFIKKARFMFLPLS